MTNQNFSHACTTTIHPWRRSDATRRTAPGTWKRASRPRSSIPPRSWRGRRGGGASGRRASRRDQPFSGNTGRRREPLDSQVGGFAVSRILMSWIPGFLSVGACGSRSSVVHRPPPHRRIRRRPPLSVSLSGIVFRHLPSHLFLPSFAPLLYCVATTKEGNVRRNTVLPSGP